MRICSTSNWHLAVFWEVGAHTVEVSLIRVRKDPRQAEHKEDASNSTREMGNVAGAARDEGSAGREHSAALGEELLEDELPKDGSLNETTRVGGELGENGDGEEAEDGAAGAKANRRQGERGSRGVGQEGEVGEGGEGAADEEGGKQASGPALGLNLPTKGVEEKEVGGEVLS
jgi:hypothetical protein